MSRRVVTEINRLKECHGFLRGMVALVKFKQTSILFDRPPRFAGKGKLQSVSWLPADRIQRDFLLFQLRAYP